MKEDNMFNLKQGTKFNVTYFAKKYGEFVTRAGVWTEKSKEWISKKIMRKFFVIMI
jgi:hypothetical protein